MTARLDLGGVIVATALPFVEDPAAPAGLAVDHDRYADHCRYLIDNGCRGVGPNGSLGEYSSLSDAERRQVVRTAVAAVGERALVVAGAHGVGWHQATQWAAWAAEDGADAVLLLPPIVYRASRADVIEHYARVNEVGIPIMVYNNPFDTKVDLTPDVVAELAQLDNVVAIKEFSGDVRRVLELRAAAPDLDVVAGADDLLFESLLDGAVGWYAGFPNALPRACTEIVTLVRTGRIDEARELYRHLVPLLRWDSRTEFVQAIKLTMDVIGESYGGPARPPRGVLGPDHEAEVRYATAEALAYLASR
ncbi:MAG: dihydrodipicolinate synthase family protein [Bifidobacteriaceae bacterium]|jgi:4-hydroxy-tetrahydrodipicolinate synthase|nr:dihydrodipicolinate synthase family protein [Bifidobacteriaceae bacterium]